jgi:hypothetical protein
VIDYANPPFNAAADWLAIWSGLSIAGEASQVFLLCWGLGYAYLGRWSRWAVAFALGAVVWAIGFVHGMALWPPVLGIQVGPILFGILVLALVVLTMADAWRLARSRGRGR